MAATDDRAAYPCCPIGFLKLARTAVMRVCVVHGHHWVTGLPLEQGVRCWRRCWRWRTAFNTPSLPCLLATREATCANSTSYRGNFPSLDVLPWACHWAGRGRSSQRSRPQAGFPRALPTLHVKARLQRPGWHHGHWLGSQPLPLGAPRAPRAPRTNAKDAKRAARRHSVPPLAAPLPERNPEVLTAALSCWNWLIAATPRQQLGRISPAYSAKWLNNLKSIIPMEEDTGRVWQSDAVRQGSLETPCRQ